MLVSQFLTNKIALCLISSIRKHDILARHRLHVKNNSPSKRPYTLSGFKFPTQDVLLKEISFSFILILHVFYERSYLLSHGHYISVFFTIYFLQIINPFPKKWEVVLVVYNAHTRL